MEHFPEILAPAGNMESALAALAAGADALYLGMKQFSARMEADNFSSAELAQLIALAHAEKRKIYIAFNTVIKTNEAEAVGRLTKRLLQKAEPDAFIVQDLAALNLLRQAGFTGELHLSTLANITHPLALQSAKAAGASRVILPRELSIDEIKTMGSACPEGLDLELFIHGALCYCVSGRCWWSSYMGGKSGLRGRCVQPCRRVYNQKGKTGRFFSSLDFSLDVLTKTLIDVPHLLSWKIEGRKKGPHYVFYTVTAYKMLRDHGADPAIRKEAEGILQMALGRPFTKARFLPQASNSPVSLSGQTGSGLLCGKTTVQKNTAPKVKTKGKEERKAPPPASFALTPRMDMLQGDRLRIGTEDEPWHSIVVLPSAVPKGGSFTLRLPRDKSPKSGTPVFLIDRREPELNAVLTEWGKKLRAFATKTTSATAPFIEFIPQLAPAAKVPRKLDILLRSSLPQGRAGKAGLRPGVVQGLWLSPKALAEVSRTLFARISWWLPPVIWPDEEEAWKRTVHHALRNGARHFVCNSPWQNSFFANNTEVVLSAGPFCNTTNPFAIELLASMGFRSAIVSPELSGDDLLALPKVSPLPVGIVLEGYWPMGISRHAITPLKYQDAFQSPKGELFWARRYGQNTWIYPGWPLDITQHRDELEAAGYSTFISLAEHPPKTLPEAKRSSEFNWALDML